MGNFLFFNFQEKFISYIVRDFVSFKQHKAHEMTVEEWLAYDLKPDRVFDIKPFDKVLVRDTDTEKWEIQLFGRIVDVENYALKLVFSCISQNNSQIAKYEGNEKYLGSTEDITGKWTYDDFRNGGE